MEMEDRGLFPVICNAVAAAAVPAIAEKFTAEDVKWKSWTEELEDMAFVLVKKHTQYMH